MAKPIFVILLPERTSTEEAMGLRESLSKFSQLTEEYHVLIFGGLMNDNIDFKTFHEKDFEDGNIETFKEELRAIFKECEVLTALNALTPTGDDYRMNLDSTSQCPIGSYEAENKIAECKGDDNCLDLCIKCANFKFK